MKGKLCFNMQVYEVRRGKLELGQIVRVDLSEGYFQVLGFIKTKINKFGDKVNFFYARKVFNGKLEFKLSKAQVIDDWLIIFPQRKKHDQINEIINNNFEIKNSLADLKIDPRYEWSTIGIFKLNESNKKEIEKHLSNNCFLLDQLSIIKVIRDVTNNKKMSNIVALSDTVGILKLDKEVLYNDEYIYRLEVGRFINDYDEHLEELHREFRFKKLNIGIRK